MRRSALLSVLLLVMTLLAPGVGIGPAPAVLAAGPTLPRYRLEVAVDYNAARLRVAQSTSFRNATGQVLDRAVFQVTPAYYGGFRLLEATAQGQTTEPILNGTILEVALPAPVAPGGTVEVGLSYEVTVPRQPGRLSAGARAMALGNWFAALKPHRGDWDRHQYTDVGDAFVTEVSDFELQLSAAAPLVVAATGRIVEDNGTSFRIQAAGVRDFALSLSPRYVVAEEQVGNATVRAYSFTSERSRLFADAAARYLRWYGEQLGAYPYQVLSVADADLPASYGGMEYPGLIMLSSDIGATSPFRGSTLDTLIGHEVAHQWFYSLVGDDQVRDPWLDEAFAEYLPYYYYRSVDPGTFSALWAGRVQDLDVRVRAAGGLLVDASVDDFPDDGPYFITVYRQGARFLDELRQAMGDAAFRAALAAEVQLFADKLASPRAVLDLLQRQSTANLNPLIARYFSYGAFKDPTPPVWRVEAPVGPWRGSADIFIGAEFPVTQVEVWLDSRKLYGGPSNALTLELTGVESGEYVLLARVWDHRGAIFERAQRVSVQ